MYEGLEGLGVKKGEGNKKKPFSPRTSYRSKGDEEERKFVNAAGEGKRGGKEERSETRVKIRQRKNERPSFTV